MVVLLSGSMAVDRVQPWGEHVRLAEAPGFGAPAVSLDRACKGSQAYVALAWEVITRNGAQAIAAQPA